MKAIEAMDDEIAKADCVLILTDHPELDYERIVELATLVVDTRGAAWKIGTPRESIVALGAEYFPSGEFCHFPMPERGDSSSVAQQLQ